MFGSIIEPGVELAPVMPHHAAEFAGHIERDRDLFETWLPWAARITDQASARAFIDRFTLKFAQADGLMTAIWREGRIVGGVLLRTVDWANGTTELGYWLSAAQSGAGLMTRAAAVMVEHVFGEMRLHRITLQAAVTNSRSRSVAERLGFKQEGILRAAGRYRAGVLDHAIYGLLADEWVPPAPGRPENGTALPTSAGTGR